MRGGMRRRGEWVLDLLVEGELEVCLILGDHVAEISDLCDLLDLELCLARSRGAVARHVGVELLRGDAADLDDEVKCVVHKPTVAALVRGWSKESRKHDTSAREKNEAGAAAIEGENVWECFRG